MKAIWMLAGVLAGGAALGGASAQELFTGKDVVVANEGTIGDRWMLAPGTELAMPAYPAPMAARGDDVCLALGYEIGVDGATSNFAVLKQWNSSKGENEPVDGYWLAFAQAGGDALSQWRFQPRPEVATARPTYTVATLVFTGAKGKGGDIRAHCRIDDLAVAIQDYKSRTYMNSREKRDLDRLNRNSRVARPPMGGANTR